MLALLSVVIIFAAYLLVVAIIIQNAPVDPEWAEWDQPVWADDDLAEIPGEPATDEEER